MLKTLTALFAAALVVAFLGVTNAHATTFCVPNFHAACPNDGTNVAQANLETAMQSNATDGIADTILVAAGSFTDPDSFTPTGTDDLTVEGAGPTTELSSTANANNYMVNLANRAGKVTMRNLKIVLPATLPDNGGAAVQIAGDTLEDVDIESRNPGSSGLVSWITSGTFRGGRIYSTGAGTIGNAIRTDGNATGTVDIEDAEIDHPQAVAVSSIGPGTVNVRRTHVIAPGQTGLSATNGTLNIDNTVIESTSNTTALYSLATSANSPSIVADHVTAISAGGNAAAFTATAGAVTGNASLTVKNSIARGYGVAYLRNATTSAVNGNANLTIRYTNVHSSGSEVSTGDGILVQTSNTDADPQFVSATDFALKPGSPSIDAGDPAAGGLTEDFLKALRPVDGDGNATAIRDQGAYEYQPPAAPPQDPADPADPVDPTDPSDPSDPQDPTGPNNGNPDTTAPETVKGKGPKAKIRKKSATFEFSSEAGATFRCTLDGKTLGSCSSPMKVKVKRGKHVFTVAAVDAAGNADPTPASWTFKVAKRKRAAR